MKAIGEELRESGGAQGHTVAAWSLPEGQPLD
jgi:hypothetical protein